MKSEKRILGSDGGINYKSIRICDVCGEEIGGFWSGYFICKSCGKEVCPYCAKESGWRILSLAEMKPYFNKVRVCIDCLEEYKRNNKCTHEEIFVK